MTEHKRTTIEMAVLGLPVNERTDAAHILSAVYDIAYANGALDGYKDAMKITVAANVKK